MMSTNSSLLQWLATFELDGSVSVEPSNDAYFKLADGYICARILNQISPQNFPDQWLEGIKPVSPDTNRWRLRTSNLNRILQKISDYASDIQHNQKSDSQSPQFTTTAIKPDVSLIAAHFNPDQISRLIQLILFCAINCDKKQHYIDKIHSLPPLVKQDIIEAIKEMIKNNESDSEFSNNLNQRVPGNSFQNTPTRRSAFRGNLWNSSFNTSTDTSRRNESNPDVSHHTTSEYTSENIEDVKQACHDLELKLRQLQLEKDQLAFDNEKLSNERNSTRLTSTPVKLVDSDGISSHNDISVEGKDISSRLQNIEDESSRNLILNQNKKLKDELQRLKEDLIKLEVEKEDYRLKSHLLTEDLSKLTIKHDELRGKADQVKQLQDELDEYKHISEKVVNYEKMMENLVKKNNEMKKELKNMEEKHVSHIHQIVRLEEDNKELTNSMSRIEIYKKQLQEAQVKLSQETYRADKAETELIQISEKFKETKRENERLFETTNQLIRDTTNPQLKPSSSSRIAQFQKKDLESENLDEEQAGSPDFVNKGFFDGNQAGNDILSSISTSAMELKERLARAEYENQLLHSKLNAKRENDNSVANGLLEASVAKCANLEVENRQARKKLMLLESRLKELASTNNGASTSTAVVFNDSGSENTLALVNRIEELQRLLFQKEQELMDSETKYKRNLQKAKDLIKNLNNNQSTSGSLHPSCMSSASPFNSSSLDETNLLKQQLQDREERLIEIEREFYEFKQLKEIHERLILSAFYGLTTQMQWRNVEKRLDRTTLTSPPNTASSSINHTKHSH